MEKLLGPTAEYLGEGLRNWSQKRIENVVRIFNSAARHLGPELEQEGAVPPRVLKGILGDGSFCDDTLMAEYFGGVLASARSGVSRDDRANSYITLLNQLSAYEVRTHYITYSILRTLFTGLDLQVGLSNSRKKMVVWIPMGVYSVAMSLVEAEEKDGGRIAHDSFLGLTQHSLIDDRLWAFGTVDHLRTILPYYRDKILGEGTVVAPSLYGVQLYLWANGLGKWSPNDFLREDLQIPAVEEVNIPSGSVALEKA